MGNACIYSCSPCQGQNKISSEILLAMEGMQHADDLIAYIDELMEKIDRGGNTQVTKPILVASYIKCGGDLMEKLSKRLNRHVCKKCLLSTLDRQTRKVVVDVLNQARHFQCVGIALSITAHLLERAEQVSAHKDQCLRLLRYMSALTTHMKNLDIHLDRAKLDKILRFIVKGTLICALQMKANILCRFISSPLDDDDLRNLESELVHSYWDLEFEALTAVLKTQNVLLANTEDVLNRLPIVPGPSQGEYPPDAVGLERAQNEVTKLLNLTESSLRVVVIYGVGGIGKTTLATAVFKSLDLTGYHYCRVDMDQDCKHSDLKAIQEQILRNLFNENLKLDNCTHGREKLSEAFGKASKPVFLFMDNALRHTDVEMLLPIQHLSGLPMRSRILLTTRSLDETTIFQLHHGIQVHSHRVDSLPEPEAKRLLCHYALGDKEGSFDRGVHMEDLLKICERIPLVLKIVGSKLRTAGNTVSASNEIVEYVKEWQRTGLEGGDEDLSERMVDFVYRRLTKPSQEAFLDIAFFFHDWERSRVEDIVGEVQLRDLEGAALVTTYEGEGLYTKYEGSRLEMNQMVKMTKLKMHDIVRARGRKLSEGNRITDLESLSVLLSDEQKLQQTKGICLDYGNNFCDYYINVETTVDKYILEAKYVDLMSRSLRVLSLGRGIRVNGLCIRAFEDLRFLDICYEDRLPIDLTKTRQLVGFHGHLMKGHRFPQLPESLRLLYLNAYPSPVSLDIYGDHNSLRELQLSNITLTNFEKSISQLKSLRSLVLYKCGGLTSIPEIIGNFSCLKMLVCKRSYLERLPESFGNLSSLQDLDMDYCPKLERLPDSFGNVSSLQTLTMAHCLKLERLPESFANITSLQDLNMDGCSKLGRLTENFGELSSLRRLRMELCSELKRLPESFGNLSSLETLHMYSCSKLQRLPESFGNLSSLQNLDMNDCSKLNRLPESFGNLSSLQNLDMSDCSKLKRLPESFGNLSSLQMLGLSSKNKYSKLERLPESFGNLSSLQDLDMSECSELERLPENFGNLSSLQRLDISYCSKLERLPQSFENLSSLQKLDISYCSKLERLPESLGNLSCLQDLSISGCSQLERLPESFGNLSSLQGLRISGCSKLEKLPQTFDQLISLQRLEIDGCEKMCNLFENFGQLKCLKFLSISFCKELKRLPEGIACLPSLLAVKAYGCTELEAKTTDSLVEIESLMFLEMGESPMLIKRWEEIQQHRAVIGAAIRFGNAEYPYRQIISDPFAQILSGKYPYREIMSAMFFSSGSRFLHVDGEGKLVEVASSSFPDVGVNVGLLLTSCDLSNQVRQNLLEVASQEIHIIYVDLDVEAEGEWEGSSWMEERDERIKKTLLQLPEGSSAWTSPFRRTSLLFAFSLWCLTANVPLQIRNYRNYCLKTLCTSIVRTSVLADEEGRRKLSHPLNLIFRREGWGSKRVDPKTVFSSLFEASTWMVGSRSGLAYDDSASLFTSMFVNLE